MRKKVTLPDDIQAILGDGRRRAQRRRMTPAQRQQSDRDAQRKRVTWEMNPRVVERVREVADVEGCSPAGAASLLLAEALRRYADGEIEFYEYKRVSRSPRWDWVIEIGDGFQL